MSVVTMLAKVRTEHLPHAGDPASDCDACRLLELVDKQREAMTRVVEGFSKSQVDPAGMSQVLRDGLGR